MRKKQFGSIFTTLSLAIFLSGCSAQLENEAGEWLTVAVEARQTATKSRMEADDGSTTSFVFENDDEMGFFAEGILNNIKLTCTNGAAGSFTGKIFVQGKQAAFQPSIDYYAYYPYSASAGKDPTALTGTLPATQEAPFDGRADYLVTDPITDVYDVDDFPALSFDFDTHLFAVVKLNVTNTNDAYAGEEILSIGLQSDNTPLAGLFTFSAIDGDVEFTEDPNYLNYKVLVEYATPPTLGTGITHSVYAVVNASSYASGTLKLVVNTTNYIFTVPSKKALRLKSYNMTSLATANVANASRRKRVQKIVLWGASTTSENYANAVRKQLGPNWEVIRGGVGGNTQLNIAVRQGGVPMVTQAKPFTIPASSEDYVSIDGLYIQTGEEGNYKYSQVDTRSYSTVSQMNPILIDGVECEAIYDEVNGRRIRRLTDGEEKVISPRTLVLTNGARNCADADVMVVQVSYNDRVSDEYRKDLMDKMKAHLTNKEATMLINGYCASPTDFPQYWNETYSKNFTEYYGDCFMDLVREGGGDNAVPLMLEIGQITNESQISAKDWEYINRDEWPLSWFAGEGNVHPNTYGSTVMAILLRRRMAELGLL